MARIELQIQLDDADADAGHVHGTVRTESGEDVAFVGWIGLLALLQQAVT